jgi:hypothetical protein
MAPKTYGHKLSDATGSDKFLVSLASGCDFTHIRILIVDTMFDYAGLCALLPSLPRYNELTPRFLEERINSSNRPKSP